MKPVNSENAVAGSAVGGSVPMPGVSGDAAVPEAARASLRELMDDRLLDALLERSRDQAGGLRLTGEGSMLGELVRAVLERALEAELTAHLGYGKSERSVTGQRKALIIANDEYEQESLRNLSAPGADAVALGRVLGDAQIGGFAVQVVRNEPAHVIEAEIEDMFSDSQPDDVLLLHFSCHGLKSESGELFFAASNTRPNRLRATAVSADFVQRCMQDARSRGIVLLLDCCYGGAFSPGVKIRAAGDVNVLDSFPRGRPGGGRGRAVITASNAMEYAFEGEQLADDQRQRPSVFTSALVEGLATGDADGDEDGLVSLNELCDYVFDKVREENPHQTPSRQIDLEGDLYLGRSRRRRIRPAPIPADLKAAMADPNMYARRGAVHELESWLASDDLPLAAGAYEALAELARTDIKYIADLAIAALGRVAIQPEETELHFGEQRQGAESPHRVVTLLGPPLARACASRASEDWIRVAETPGGLDISVGTTGTGALHGSVDLNGPTGAAVIAVDVEVLPLAERSSRTQPADQEDAVPAMTAEEPEWRPAAAGSEEAQQADAPESTASASLSKAQAAPAPSANPLAERPRRRRYRIPLAVAGAVVAGAAIITPLVLSRHPASTQASTTSQTSETAKVVPFSWYRAGDCLDGSFPYATGQDWPSGTQVPCDISHNAEVYYANFGYWPQDAPNPGAKSAANMSVARCNDEFAAYDGASSRSSEYGIAALSPQSAQAWQEGLRYLVCVAYNSQYSRVASMIGSIKGSRM
jgi:Caspase domain/Septum formation